MHGRKQLTYSRGMRARLTQGVPEASPPDDELDAGVPELVDGEIAAIAAPLWAAIETQAGFDRALLQRFAAGGFAVASAWLTTVLGAEWTAERVAEQFRPFDVPAPGVASPCDTAS